MNYTSTMQTKTNGHSLPKGWQWVKLGDVCDFIRGVSFKPHDARSTPAPGFLPILRAGNIGDSLDTQNDLIWVTSKNISNEQRMRVGDIAICMASGSPTVVGKTAQLNVSFSGSVGAFCGIIRPKDLTQSDYLAHWLHSPDFIKWRDGQARGANIQNLRFSQFIDLQIPLPPLDEQRQIASRLNEQLAAVESARMAAEEQLHAAYDLPLAYLREVFESEEAKNWQSKFIGDLAETCSGSTPLRSRGDYYIGGTIPWVKTGELKDGTIYDTEEHITELALKESSLKLLPENTLLIAMYGQGQTRGRTSIITKPMTVNQACFAIMPNESFNTEFLQFWFRYSYDRLRKETEGRGGNQPNLNGQVLNKQRVLLPPIDEQKRIVKSLKEKMQQSELVIDQLESQLDEINLLPASLLREAFAGQG